MEGLAFEAGSSHPVWADNSSTRATTPTADSTRWTCPWPASLFGSVQEGSFSP
jgi:hypothetical protein